MITDFDVQIIPVTKDAWSANLHGLDQLITSWGRQQGTWKAKFPATCSTQAVDFERKQTCIVMLTYNAYDNRKKIYDLEQETIKAVADVLSTNVSRTPGSLDVYLRMN